MRLTKKVNCIPGIFVTMNFYELPIRRNFMKFNFSSYCLFIAIACSSTVERVIFVGLIFFCTVNLK